jgi:hypothetical protein
MQVLLDNVLPSVGTNPSDFVRICNVDVICRIDNATDHAERLLQYWLNHVDALKSIEVVQQIVTVPMWLEEGMFPSNWQQVLKVCGEVVASYPAGQTRDAALAEILDLVTDALADNGQFTGPSSSSCECWIFLCALAR